MSKIFIIFCAVVLLIVTKTVDIVHWSYVGGYWDLDRVVGLLVFLWVAHRYIEPLRQQSVVVLLGLLSLFYGLDAISSQLGITRILQLLVLTALVEEILLRGVLFELLLKKLSPKSTLLLTTVLFTAVHAKAYTDVYYAVALVVTGLILGGVYLHYRRYGLQQAVLAATGVHMAIIMLGVNLGTFALK